MTDALICDADGFSLRDLRTGLTGLHKYQEVKEYRFRNDYTVELTIVDEHKSHPYNIYLSNEDFIHLKRHLSNEDFTHIRCKTGEESQSVKTEPDSEKPTANKQTPIAGSGGAGSIDTIIKLKSGRELRLSLEDFEYMTELIENYHSS